MKKVEKDEEVLPNLESNCVNCRWYLENQECTAFKGKIPEDIWKGVHDKVVDGQLFNITYSPKGNIL